MAQHFQRQLKLPSSDGRRLVFVRRLIKFVSRLIPTKWHLKEEKKIQFYSIVRIKDESEIESPSRPLNINY